MKSTNKKQSKRLLNCGVSATSADMAYPNVFSWSLSRLIEMMPEKIVDPRGRICFIRIEFYLGLWYVSYWTDKADYCYLVQEDKCIIESCVKMIERLKQLEFDLKVT